MATSNPFLYSECLPAKTLARTPEILKINGNNDPAILLIVRLLSGAIKVEHVSSSKSFLQKENYFSSNFKGISQKWDKLFPLLIAENYTSEDFAGFIEIAKQQNIVFYKNILSELSYYFYYQSKGIHSSSFVYLYRALEHVSYALPLIYASKAHDFTKTFIFLKNLMSGDKNAGELGFFKSFIKTVYADDAIFDSSIDFPMLLDTESEQKKAFTLLHELCKSDMIAESTDKPRLLSIKYTEVGSFIITIRNRFFHYMNGGAKNIETSNISDIDLLFSLVNKQCLYWLSTITLAVITHSALELDSIKTRLNNTAE